MSNVLEGRIGGDTARPTFTLTLLNEGTSARDANCAECDSAMSTRKRVVKDAISPATLNTGNADTLSPMTGTAKNLGGLPTMGASVAETLTGQPLITVSPVPEGLTGDVPLSVTPMTLDEGVERITALLKASDTRTDAYAKTMTDAALGYGEVCYRMLTVGTVKQTVVAKRLIEDNLTFSVKGEHYLGHDVRIIRNGESVTIEATPCSPQGVLSLAQAYYDLRIVGGGALWVDKSGNAESVPGESDTVPAASILGLVETANRLGVSGTLNDTAKAVRDAVSRGAITPKALRQATGNLAKADELMETGNVQDVAKANVLKEGATHALLKALAPKHALTLASTSVRKERNADAKLDRALDTVLADLNLRLSNLAGDVTAKPILMAHLEDALNAIVSNALPAPRPTVTGTDAHPDATVTTVDDALEGSVTPADVADKAARDNAGRADYRSQLPPVTPDDETLANIVRESAIAEGRVPVPNN